MEFHSGIESKSLLVKGMLGGGVIKQNPTPHLSAALHLCFTLSLFARHLLYHEVSRLTGRAGPALRQTEITVARMWGMYITLSVLQITIVRS